MAESRNSGRYLAPALVACAAATAPHAAELTIDRLFDAPALAGPSIIGLKISPDSSRVTYLQGKTEEKDRLDLWEYNIADREARLLVDSRVLAPGEEKLSAEELGRRERQRTAALSGILEYSFAPSGRALLFPLNGRLYYYDLGKSPDKALLEIARGSEGFSTDASISPRGGYVSYIRDQNLRVYDLVTGKDKALTEDGGGAIKNGMAEFVAQEEMDRNTGYWWSPDERHIAFVRVDESPVKLTQRFEISADNVDTFPQRYPATGGPNVLVRFGVADVRTGAVTWIDLGSNPDIYLARVNWLPDGKTLAIQRESRDQRRLDLIFADVESGASRVVLTETSDSWIELNDELSFLKKSKEFVWASARDGFTHLYLYDYGGHLVRRLTAGRWNVDDFRTRAIKAIDEKRRLIYFSATEKSPLERHLYRTSLDTHDPQHAIRGSRKRTACTASPCRAAPSSTSTVSRAALNRPRSSLHKADGGLIAYLVENRLDAGHPDAPYAADNSTPEFGVARCRRRTTARVPPVQTGSLRSGKRYPAIVEVYGGPGVQRVLDTWTGASFTQILTRAGYVVFQLDNRGSAFRGTAFQAPIRGRLGEIEVADQVRGRQVAGRAALRGPRRASACGAGATAAT